MKRINHSELIALFSPDAHDAVEERLARTDVHGMVVFENLQMDSSAFGHRTGVVYGPGLTFESLEAVAGKRLGDVPSRFQYPTYYYVKRDPSLDSLSRNQ